MSIRETGLRRVAAVTTGLVAAGVVSSVGVAVVARGHTLDERSSTPTETPSSPTPTKSGAAPTEPDITEGPTAGEEEEDWAPGGEVEETDKKPHATSGGS